VERARAGAGILKGAGIGADGGEQKIRDRLGDRPARGLEQPMNQLAGGRFARRNPVDVAIPRVALVMVDVDELLALL
jgi:hypothetical protein